MITLSPAVASTAAGRLQVSVQIPPAQLTTSSFSLSGILVSSPTADPVAAEARFVPSQLEFYPGFTTFSADAQSATIQIEFSQLQIVGVSNNNCVIVHEPAMDPLDPANQLAVSSGCS